MTTLPPWHTLKSRPKNTDEEDLIAAVDWLCPPFLQLDKHVRVYRDLMKSTEKVELTLSHSGKAEVFDTYDDPQDPTRTSHQAAIKPEVILVPIRGDADPRMDCLSAKDEGVVLPRPEYRDSTNLRDILTRRAIQSTPAPSRAGSPLGSPKSAGFSTPSGFGKITPQQSPSSVSQPAGSVLGFVGMVSQPATLRPPPPPPPGGPPKQAPPPPPPKGSPNRDSAVDASPKKPRVATDWTNGN